MAQNQTSLQIRTAELLPATTNRPAELKITGTVTVYEAFSVFGQPIRIQLGKKDVTFTPNERGEANSGDAAFRVLSQHNYGVVYGGQMEFEITLRGPEWFAELMTDAQSNALPILIPFQLSVGDVHHLTSVPLEQILKNDLSRQ
jgi:hypothetical protein